MLSAYGSELWWLIAALYCGMGGITFLVYGADKRRARLGRKRIPERTLHLLELLFGWFGALFAQRTYHHKTRKTPYQLAFWSIGGCHVLLMGLMVYLTRFS